MSDLRRARARRSALTGGVAAAFVVGLATLACRDNTAPSTIPPDSTVDSVPPPPPPPPPAPVTFVGAGDIHAGCRIARVDSATAALLADIDGTVFTLGDNAGDGSASSFTACFEPYWGRHKGRIRPTLGNHDYDTGDASGYFGYFGAAAGDSSQGYYSYDLGGWHVVVLNSNVAVSETAAQYAWLRADLAGSRRRCTIALFHHPRFSSGVRHGSAVWMMPMWNVLYEFGAEVVLNGHEHFYERFTPQTPAGAADSVYGIREFIVGTAGTDSAAMYPFKSTPLATSEVRHTGTPGVLKLTLAATGYRWEFVPIAGHQYQDAGSDHCHDAPPAPAARVL